jgi:FKBP-type peptidyl-prolyl cis-trans isomerase (trigger factor)
MSEQEKTNDEKTPEVTTASTPEIEIKTEVTNSEAVVGNVVEEPKTEASSNTEVVTENSTVVASVVSELKTKKFCNPVIRQYAIAFAVVAIMGLTLWYFMEEQGRVKTHFFADIKGLVVPEPAAAKVNGERVAMALYQRNFDQLKSQAASQGQDVADEKVLSQIKQQSIDILVNGELLRQAAAEAGIKVTEDQIKERYDSIVESQGGEEGLNSKMAEMSITKESLMKDIEQEILIQAYIDKAVDTSSIKVTDEEIKQLYDSVAANPDAKLPPLEEVKDQIEQEIKYGKQQEMISKHIDTLKEKAEIEVLI